MLDQRQLALDLPLRALPQLTLAGTLITISSALQRACSQKRVHRFIVGYRVPRKFVAELVQGEFETRRKFDRVGGGFRQVGKEPQHLLRRFEIALAVAGQQASGGIKRAMVTNAGKSIQN